MSGLTVPSKDRQIDLCLPVFKNICILYNPSQKNCKHFKLNKMLQQVFIGIIIIKYFLKIILNLLK